MVVRQCLIRRVRVERFRGVDLADVELLHDVLLLGVELGSAGEGGSVCGGNRCGGLGHGTKRLALRHAGVEQALAGHRLFRACLGQGEQRGAFGKKPLQTAFYRLLRGDIPFLGGALLGVVGIVAALVGGVSARSIAFRGVASSGVAFRGVSHHPGGLYRSGLHGICGERQRVVAGDAAYGIGPRLVGLGGCIFRLNYGLQVVKRARRPVHQKPVGFLQLDVRVQPAADRPRANLRSFFWGQRVLGSTDLCLRVALRYQIFEVVEVGSRAACQEPSCGAHLRIGVEA